MLGRGGDGLAETISNPILNSPYDQPDRHFEISLQEPTGVIKPGRRPSESYIPTPATRKGEVQEELDFETTHERSAWCDAARRRPSPGSTGSTKARSAR